MTEPTRTAGATISMRTAPATIITIGHAREGSEEPGTTGGAYPAAPAGCCGAAKGDGPGAP
ncbi:hypothetical protein ACFQWG_00585 [Schaalia naturae]|uniref:Uncharacterized protein n=1 Tax=Schaalia naturae TaxID=635203 RepID=A0ABW2SHX9_9ACTO